MSETFEEWKNEFESEFGLLSEHQEAAAFDAYANSTERAAEIAWEECFGRFGQDFPFKPCGGCRPCLIAAKIRGD